MTQCELPKEELVRRKELSDNTLIFSGNPVFMRLLEVPDVDLITLLR